MTKDPAKSRPLSANVKRLMKAARSSPRNPEVIKAARSFENRDYIYCHMQGNIFMEAAFKGRPMSEFAPLWMNSQIAGLFDVSFAAAGGMETDTFSNILKIPLLLKTPGMIVDTLYWVDEVVRDQDNKAMALYQAMLKLPDGEKPDPAMLPEELRGMPLPEETRQIPALSEFHVEQGEASADTSVLEYAYWLGFIYRCECLLHEESSHMVYGAFNEEFMWKYYQDFLKSKLVEKDLSETALGICGEIDRLLVEEIWIQQPEQAGS